MDIKIYCLVIVKNHNKNKVFAVLGRIGLFLIFGPKFCWLFLRVFFIDYLFYGVSHPTSKNLPGSSYGFVYIGVVILFEYDDLLFFFSSVDLRIF